MRQVHEFRDPIHTAISVTAGELKVIDSQFFQRLRHIHQLALTYLVFPGATHKRFEHSIGVMELASRIFDVVTDDANLVDNNVRKIIPDRGSKQYWKSLLRTAALCHDLGHLPFSHAAEELLPDGYDHEQLTRDIIHSPSMRKIWSAMTPPLLADDIVRLAIGEKAVGAREQTTWEAILAQIISGEAFGADRMDYLLRDSYHLGVQFGFFDCHRLIKSLRILPVEHGGADKLALGVEASALETSEKLMVARESMFKHVYFHPTRRIYDIHLRDFLKTWLPGGRFSTNLRKHLQTSDLEILSAMRRADSNRKSPRHELARRIQRREHFLLFCESYLNGAGDALANSAEKQFGADAIRYDRVPAAVPVPEFPIWHCNGKIESSLRLSRVPPRAPEISIGRIYCKASMHPAIIRWRYLRSIPASSDSP